MVRAAVPACRPPWPAAPAGAPLRADRLGPLPAERFKLFLRKWVAPKYDEITLYAMSVSLVLIVLVDAVLSSQVVWFFRHLSHPAFLLVEYMFLGGLVFSVYHAFSESEKTETARGLMLTFAVLLQAGAGLVGALHLGSAEGGEGAWLFPAWGLLNSCLLLFFYRIGVLDASCILEHDATPRQVLAATVGILGVVWVGYDALGYHWTVTLAMSVALASIVSRAVQWLPLHPVEKGAPAA